MWQTPGTEVGDSHHFETAVFARVYSLSPGEFWALTSREYLAFLTMLEGPDG